MMLYLAISRQPSAVRNSGFWDYEKVSHVWKDDGWTRL